MPCRPARPAAARGLLLHSTYPLQRRPRLAVRIRPSRAEKAATNVGVGDTASNLCRQAAHWVPKWLKPSAGGRDAVSAFFRKNPSLQNLRQLKGAALT